MKTITKEFPREDLYPIEKITKGCVPVLFDIETTGLSAASAYIYLIGALEIKSDRLIFIQWFAEKPEEERLLIEKFFSWIPVHACLIHFNGRGFDIPFISKKCRQHDIKNTLPQLPDIDLYRSFACLKNYFDMPGRKLVSYEQLIGINREDQYNGGELINVYKNYIGKSKFDPAGAEELLHLLLLHNEEDIKDMVPVLSLFTFLDLFNGNFSSYTYNVSDTSTPVPESENEKLIIELEMDYPFPLSSHHKLATMPEMDMITIDTYGKKATITIPIINARLKHFFEDYKSYYYLPDEDLAIHKSAAAVHPSSQKHNATRRTAYSYASGSFIPQTGTALKPYFKYNFEDRMSFISLKSLKNTDDIKAFIKALF